MSAFSNPELVFEALDQALGESGALRSPGH